MVKCSPTTHSRLFYGLSGSYGSLGKVLAAEIRCIKAKPWVEVQCECIADPEQAKEVIEQACLLNTSTSTTTTTTTADKDKDKNKDKSSRIIDFVEALQFPHRTPIGGPTGGGPTSPTGLGPTVVMTSRLVDVPGIGGIGGEPHSIFRPSVVHERWFYEEIERRMDGRRASTKEKEKDNDKDHTFFLNIPVEDFMFRYDRGAFWMSRPTRFDAMAMLRWVCVSERFLTCQSYSHSCLPCSYSSASP